MKKVLPADVCYSQQSEEAELRSIENSEREALLNGDTAMLLKLLSPKVVVNNPENTIVTFEQIKERIRSGKIDYSSLERVIENLSFVENIAIVMGKEIIMPQGAAKNAGKTVTRRFTNIWMKTEGVWKLIARQSTTISVK